MDIRRITPDYAVAPQIAAEDFATLAEQGFRMVINNRPDAEVEPGLHSADMQAAAEAAGLAYVENPVVNGALTMDMVTGQAEALAAADGPILAYCRSGTRSTIMWAFASAGKVPTADLLSAAAEAGYDLSAYADQIDALAQS